MQNIGNDRSIASYEKFVAGNKIDERSDLYVPLLSLPLPCTPLSFRSSLIMSSNLLIEVHVKVLSEPNMKSCCSQTRTKQSLIVCILPSLSYPLSPSSCCSSSPLARFPCVLCSDLFLLLLSYLHNRGHQAFEGCTTSYNRYVQPHKKDGEERY